MKINILAATLIHVNPVIHKWEVKYDMHFLFTYMHRGLNHMGEDDNNFNNCLQIIFTYSIKETL